MSPGFFDGSLLGHAHPMLDLGEGLFDRVQVGRVWRQVPKPRSGRSDRGTHCLALMAAQIVHDDDVVGLKHGHELLFDPCPEALTINWSVKDARRSQAIAAQSADEGQGPPMAMWGEAAQALALVAPSAQWCHVGLDPCFIDEDQPLGIEMRLEGSPSLAPAGNVGAALLKGEQRFF